MAKYSIEFSKSGYFCYTSHLDLIRYFKRAFKRCDIHLKHSQGFNPHPKLAFAQPLSLGYSSECELLEIETISHFEPEELLAKLGAGMAEGIKLKKCTMLPENTKALASKIVAAEYEISIPVDDYSLEEVLDNFSEQSNIIAMKRQKKTKELKPVNIAGKIKSLKGRFAEYEEGTGTGHFVITALLDAGSESNLNPELLITAFMKFAGIEDISREKISVHRKRLIVK